YLAASIEARPSKSAAHSPQGGFLCQPLPSCSSADCATGAFPWKTVREPYPFPLFCGMITRYNNSWKWGML
ncbi:MAG: hypothetical protein ACLUFA_00065, partial [[Clostridium] leptum]